MTNYNERLDEIVRSAYSGEVSWIHDQLDGTSVLEEALARNDNNMAATKQALTSLIKELLLSCAPDTNRTFGKNIKMCLYCTEPMGNKSVCDCIEKSQVDAVVAEFIKNIEELF